MNQSIYIDANILIGLFEKDKDVNKLSNNTIRQAITMANNPEIKIKIPSIALAEFTLWCIRQNCLEDVAAKFYKYLFNLKADFPTPTKEHYKKAKTLMELDERYESHDSLIVSHALLDSDTTWLLTTETNLHFDPNIEKEKDELGNKFKISDRF